MLTILGILLGFFIILINQPNQPILSSYVILTGLGTSISMLISGVSGSYLSEKAEQKKYKKELDKAMAMLYSETDIGEEINNSKIDDEEIQKAMVIPIKNNSDKKKRVLIFKSRDESRKIRTIHEKAERFTGIVVSIINGISPFCGGVVAILPFFFVTQAGLNVFISSFIIIFICIIFLGMFLGIISKESILKNVLQMLAAFILTIIITIFLLRI
ncbi:MAG: hypothetical protein EU539_04515 [Promethearchaeota archaeon]|nr:MAG: hypothetical protein EU539_04515 [Candidatus Lokiarchaeota archaeon]